jgi:hypothetical protein
VRKAAPVISREDEFMMNPKLLLYGFALWLAGTVALRLWGQYVLQPDIRQSR